jgi:hypothetical protein
MEMAAIFEVTPFSVGEIVSTASPRRSYLRIVAPASARALAVEANAPFRSGVLGREAESSRR